MSKKQDQRAASNVRSRGRFRGAKACIALSAAIILASSGAVAGTWHGEWAASGQVNGPIRYEGTSESLSQHPLPEWWDEGKFGIFIHWGPPAISGKTAKICPDNVMENPFFEDAFLTHVPDGWYQWAIQVPFFAWADARCRGPFEGRGQTMAEYHKENFGDATYNDFIRAFPEAKFDAREWYSVIESSGAKYFVMFAKSHDGLALWDTKATNRKTTTQWEGENGHYGNVPTDVIRELFDASERAGNTVKPGIYYALTEFENPLPRPADLWDGVYGGNLVWGGGPPGEIPFAFRSRVDPGNLFSPFLPYIGHIPGSDYYEDYVKVQFQELIHEFRPYVIWCDVGGPEYYFKSNDMIADFYNMALEHRPEGVVVNNRCGDDTTHRDYATLERGANFANPYPEDISVRSEVARNLDPDWFHSRHESDARILKSGELIRLLAEAVAHNSNFLLNIGPRADGTIPPYVKRRLADIGDWLDINGQSVFGTRPVVSGGKRVSDKNGSVFTESKTGDFYLHAIELERGESVLKVKFPSGTHVAPTLALVADSDLTVSGRRSWAWGWGDRTVQYTIPDSFWDSAPERGHLVFKVQGMEL